MDDHHEEDETMSAALRWDERLIVTMPISKLERDIRKGSWAMTERAALEGLRRLRDTLRLAWAATRENATDDDRAALVAHLESMPKETRDRDPNDRKLFQERMLDSIGLERPNV
jgi:hypothetical protein